MKRESELTKESFDLLLRWLHGDREEAGHKYERIRLRLIKIFVCRGCAEAEDLADEAINRVCLRLPEIESTYIGDPALYFYGVANKLHLEYLRKAHSQPVAVTPSVQSVETREAEMECLDHCIGKLSAKSRDLVLRYYAEEKHSKIINRKDLAAELGIALNALRIRAHRIRASLQQCVSQCLDRQFAN
jgi:DNA-directed RNA polymerase specialized sigma24 family protein